MIVRYGTKIGAHSRSRSNKAHLAEKVDADCRLVCVVERVVHEAGD
jgi:hypothetical protein